MTLTPEVRAALLEVARQAIQARLQGEAFHADPAQYPEALQQPAACFVSLHQRADQDLRGCIGCLEAEQPLLECVAEHAVSCAFSDPRFAPLKAEEVAGLELEVSVLSPMASIPAESPVQLLAALTPRQHGLVLAKGKRRATFLPQVWQSLPDPDHFLHALLRKGGWLAWPEEGGMQAWRFTVAHVSGPLA